MLKAENTISSSLTLIAYCHSHPESLAACDQAKWSQTWHRWSSFLPSATPSLLAPTSQKIVNESQSLIFFKDASPCQCHWTLDASWPWSVWSRLKMNPFPGPGTDAQSCSDIDPRSRFDQCWPWCVSFSSTDCPDQWHPSWGPFCLDSDFDTSLAIWGCNDVSDWLIHGVTCSYVPWHG